MIVLIEITRKLSVENPTYRGGLESNGVTLLPLLVKETSYFLSVTHFPCNGPVTITVTDILNVTKSLRVTTKCNKLRSGTVTLLTLCAKCYFLYASIDVVTIS
jgi:hypothetical protein